MKPLNSEFFEEKFAALLRHLDNQELSVLIGAGFSKNANDSLFLSWRQLLEQMVLKMFEKQYKYDFKEKVGRPWHTSKSKYDIYVKGRIEQYIDEEGYLNTVSNYINKMGYRETVELYIEEHTPIADTIEGQSVLLTYEDGKRERKTLLTESDLSIHRALLRLPWSNIFTTNYDNLLEFCSNRDYEIVDNLLNEYTQQLQANNDVLRNKKKRVEELSKRIEEKDTVITNLYLSEVNEGKNVNTKELKKQSEINIPASATVEDLQNEKLIIEKEIDLITNENSTISRKITDLKSNSFKTYSEITHSSELEIKRTKNIIKLHGTIRKDPSDAFAFDNDYSKCYVISKEDYDSYPTKHEAFTQLMRITILQGYFCLIGFSGDDPNFIAWISWIRDIVTKKAHLESSNNKMVQAKIFFIDVTANKAANSHRQQFYNNHKIVYIPLGHKASISILSKYSNTVIDPKNPKEILSCFLRYLSRGRVVNRQQTAAEVKFREYYESFFSKLRSLDKDVTYEKLQEISKEFLNIKTLKYYARITSIQFSIDNSRREFLKRINNYLEIAREDKNLQVNILSIMVQTIWDTYAPPSKLVVNFQEYIDKSETLCSHLHEEFLLLKMFDAVWHSEEDKVADLYKTISLSKNIDIAQMAYFLGALHYNLTFNIKRRDEILKAWQPTNHWLNIKYTFKLKNNGLKTLDGFEFPTLQEELYSLELQSLYFFQQKIHVENKDRINNLYSAKLRSINYNLDYLEEEFKEKNKPIRPFGDGRNTVSRTIYLSNASKDVQSLQLFGLLMMSGFPLRIGYVKFKSSQNVFPAIKIALEYAPIPVLFYALQYTDKKFIQRIGQEYAAQPAIDKCRNAIIIAMENAYFANGHTHSKTSITLFLSEYIDVIDQCVLTDLFNRIWLDKKQKKTLYIDDVSIGNAFLEKSIALLTDAKIMANIINDCFEAILKDQSQKNPAFNYLFLLTQNPYYKKNGKVIEELIDKTFLEELIRLLSLNPDILFVVAYVTDFLPLGSNENIKRIIGSWDLKSISNINIWSVICYFIKQDSELQRTIIASIIKSENLWNAGIKGDTISIGNNFIKLRKIRKSPNSDYGLSLTKDEASLIFDKLELTLNQIEMKSDVGRGIVSFKFILQEMIWFLEDEVYLLKELQGYNNILNKAKEIFEREKSGHDTFTGLLSDSDEDISWAIMEVSRQLYNHNNFQEHKKHLDIILNRILCKNPIGLELCLHYLTIWLYSFKDIETLKIYEVEIIEILKLYCNDYPENTDPAFIESLLVKIAYVINYWGNNDSIVLNYLKLLKESRYNSVKNILSLSLKCEK